MEIKPGAELVRAVKGRVGFPGRWSATCPHPFDRLLHPDDEPL